jgi:hypothetical protein
MEHQDQTCTPVMAQEEPTAAALLQPPPAVRPSSPNVVTEQRIEDESFFPQFPSQTSNVARMQKNLFPTPPAIVGVGGGLRSARSQIHGNQLYRHMIEQQNLKLKLQQHLLSQEIQAMNQGREVMQQMRRVDGGENTPDKVIPPPPRLVGVDDDGREFQLDHLSQSSSSSKPTAADKCEPSCHKETLDSISFETQGPLINAVEESQVESSQQSDKLNSQEPELIKTSQQGPENTVHVEHDQQQRTLPQLSKEPQREPKHPEDFSKPKIRTSGFIGVHWHRGASKYSLMPKL